MAAIEKFSRRYVLPLQARALDGGTLGLALLSLFEGGDDVIIVDAIRADQPAGSFVHLEGDDVAPAVRTRLSVHQIGVADLLDGLRLLDAYPLRLHLLGLVPATLELGLARSPAVDRNLPLLVQRIADEARRMGYAVSPRLDPPSHLSDRRGRLTHIAGL